MKKMPSLCAGRDLSSGYGSLLSQKCIWFVLASENPAGRREARRESRKVSLTLSTGEAAFS